VRILLDTQAWLWMNAEPERLGSRATEIVTDSENELFLSAASSWEIAIKHALGRLPLPEPPETYVPDRLRRTACTPLAVEHSHTLAVATLPHHHRDPFDRLLVAQARLLDVALLTSNAELGLYDVEIISATE
jgi:PIN domain nuclease of toxin-antitoxin system